MTKLSQALVEKRTASKKPDNAASITYVSFVHYCGHSYLCSWPVLVNLGEGCNNIVEPVGLDMSPVHFKRQTCGGAAAHYVIMLSERLFILTSSSRTVTSAPTAAPSTGEGASFFRPNQRQMHSTTHPESPQTASACSSSAAAPVAASSNAPPSIIKSAN